MSPLRLCWVKGVCVIRCNLHLLFWQNGRGLLRAIAITGSGVEWTSNLSQHRKLTLKKKIDPRMSDYWHVGQLLSNRHQASCNTRSSLAHPIPLNVTHETSLKIFFKSEIDIKSTGHFKTKCLNVGFDLDLFNLLDKWRIETICFISWINDGLRRSVLSPG